MNISSVTSRVMLNCVVACSVEDILDLVGQVVDVRQPEHGRQALEAVGRAKHLIQQIARRIAAGDRSSSAWTHSSSCSRFALSWVRS